jgi:RIO kinase 1
MKNYTNYLDIFERDGFEKRKKMKRRPKSSHGETTEHLTAPLSDGETFNPTFHSSRHEREWILTYLGGFYNDQMITDVLRQIKGGKEATVYCCAAHPSTGFELIAAKVYRPRMFRNLRNDAQYRQGREELDRQGKGVRNRRALLAMKQGTRFGKELRHTSWLRHEYATLSLLHAAGADVPQPITCSDNAILMEYLGDVDSAAPPLSDVTLDRAEARPLFERLMYNVDLMLSQARVHGDLSAYNVLYWDGAVRLIDFPQAVDPFINADAYELLARDIQRLCQYFTRYSIAADAKALANELWSRHFGD